MKTRVLIWCLAASLALQAGVAVLARGLPLWADEAEYVAVARTFAATGELVSPSGKFYVHMHPPLYPIFVGLAWAAGGSLNAVRVLNVVLNLLTLALCYLGARRVWGVRAAGAAAVAAACYVPAAFYAWSVLSEVPFAFLLAGGVFLFARGWEGWPSRRGELVAAGAVIGAGALVRAVAFPAGLVLAGAFVVSGRLPFIRRAARTAAFALPFLAPVAAWSVYVWFHTGHFVLVDAGGGTVLYLGNNPRTPYNHSWDVFGDDVAVTPQTLASRAGVDVFRVDAEYRARALRYMWEHPFPTVARVACRVVDLCEPDRLFGGMFLRGYFKGVPSVLAAAAVGAEMLTGVAGLFLVVAGLILAPPGRWRDAMRLVLVAVVGVHALTVTAPRYLVPVVMAEMGAAGYALAVGLPELVRGRRRRGQVVAVAFALALAAFACGRALVLYYEQGR